MKALRCALPVSCEEIHYTTDLFLLVLSCFFVCFFHLQKELEQSRQEIAELRKQLQEAMVTLETRNKELQDTQKKVETLTNQSTADRHKIDRLEVSLPV